MQFTQTLNVLVINNYKRIIIITNCKMSHWNISTSWSRRYSWCCLITLLTNDYYRSKTRVGRYTLLFVWPIDLHPTLDLFICSGKVFLVWSFLSYDLTANYYITVFDCIRPIFIVSYIRTYNIYTTRIFRQVMLFDIPFILYTMQKIIHIYLFIGLKI